VSAHNLRTLIKRTSLIVYDADIFNCSRQTGCAGIRAVWSEISGNSREAGLLGTLRDFGTEGAPARRVRLMRSDFARTALARLQEDEGGHEDDRLHAEDSVNDVIGEQRRLLLDSVIGNRESRPRIRLNEGAPDIHAGRHGRRAWVPASEQSAFRSPASTSPARVRWEERRIDCEDGIIAAPAPPWIRRTTTISGNVRAAPHKPEATTGREQTRRQASTSRS